MFGSELDSHPTLDSSIQTGEKLGVFATLHLVDTIFFVSSSFYIFNESTVAFSAMFGL